MMNITKIRRKMKSEEGASLMLALLFFVICAMVASVILAAATAAYGRISNLHDSDQNRYALESAADVLEHQLEGWTYTLQYTTETDPSDATKKIYKEEKAKTWKNKDGTVSYEATPTADPAHQKLLYAELVEQQLRHVLEDTAGVDQNGLKANYSYTISVSGSKEGIDYTKIPDVEAELEEIREDDLTIILKLTAGEGAEMYLTFPGDFQQHSEMVDGEEYEVAEVTWRTYNAVINDEEYKPTPAPAGG